MTKPKEVRGIIDETVKERGRLDYIFNNAGILILGETQDLELEHWLTGLTAAQIKQILAQQKTEEEILKELYNEEDSELQDLTKQCLVRAGLDARAYEDLLDDQREEKLDYLLDKGLDDEYDQLLEVLAEEEAIFLQDLGVVFEELEECIMTLSEDDDTPKGPGPGPQTIRPSRLVHSVF